MLLISLVISISCSALLPLITTALSDSDIFEAIDLSVKRVQQRSQNVFYAVEQACYSDIGCFSTDGPMKHIGILPDSPETIATKFFAFTHDSPNTSQEINLKNTTNYSIIAADKPLAIIIHGFNNDAKTEELLSLKNSLLQYSKVGAVIITDWSKGAGAPWYDSASVNTQLVGRQVALLVNRLKESRNVKPENVHLLGFSLGAQVSGFAGKWSQSAYKWTFGRITAMDAAAPLFEEYPGSFLTRADASFVDAIHTSAGLIVLLGEVGFKEPIGHIDFYPNGGAHQPRCSLTIHISCNHYSSVLYNDASLSAASKCDFKAYKCNDWNEFSDNKCADTKGDSRMGYFSVDQTGRGNHYLTTTKNYPFC